MSGDWQGFSDEDFFRVLESDAYRRRFHGCGHPIYPENGGLEFYNPERLRKEITALKAGKLKQGHPKNRWIYEKRIEVWESWLEQAEWIVGHLEVGL